MSRRKQSNPKPLKQNTEKTVDELDELCRAHNLPTDMLQLQEVPDCAPEIGVYAGVALPRGSSFGPFRGAKIAEADREQHTCVLEMPLAEEDCRVFLSVENAAGHWLKLLRTTATPEKSSVGICLQRNFEGGQAVWCEIHEDIPVGSELLAFYREDPYVPLPNPPSPTPVSPTSLPPSADVSGVAVPNLATQLEHAVMPLVVKPERCSSPESHSQPPAVATSPPRYPLIYDCPHCGIKFSSPSTLDAHMSYYCTKKPTEVTNENALQPPGPHPVMLSPRAASVSPRAALLPSDVTSGGLKQEPSSPHSGHGSESLSGMKREASLDSGEEGAEEGSKSARLGGIFQCPYCPYNSERKVCLNRHLKQHTPAQERSRAASPAEDNFRANETFCYQCNIQFSSYKTYRGHKEFYCGMRQRAKDTVTSPSSPRSRADSHVGSPKGSPGKVSAAFDMETLLKVGAGQSLGGPPLLPPAGGSVMMSAPVMTSGGMANVTFNMPAMLMQPMLAMQSALAAQSAALASQPPPPTSASSTRTSDMEAPLDLSVKKEEEEINVCEPQGKEDQKGSPRPLSASSDNLPRSPKQEAISPTRSTQNSPRQSSSSPRIAHPSTATPDVLSAASSPLFPALATTPIEILPRVPLLMPSNVSKCLDCSIVFYKHENYVVHKELYCAGRRLKNALSPEARLLPPGSIENGTSPTPSCSEASVSSLTRTSPGHSPAVEKDTLEPHNIHSCKPCKIKFSSADTLKAHQQFYCPAPKEPTSDVHPHVSPTAMSRQEEDSGDSQDGLFTCTQCGNCYPSYRHMRMHFCNPAAALQVPLLRCPYCDFITKTDQRLVDHIRAHAPSKAYKCKLCGYRGNTVRGMRMHGKTHELSGEAFNDEEILEFEEPPLIPKRLKTLYSDPLVVDYEAELLRIKNEPYKRRRSRKSFEKAEHNPPRGPAGHMCFVCHESFPDLIQMHQHMRTHLAEQSAFCCRSCDFVSTTKSGLVRHVKMMHENLRDLEPGQLHHEDTDSRSEFMMRQRVESYLRDDVTNYHKPSLSSSPSPSFTNTRYTGRPPTPSSRDYPNLCQEDDEHAMRPTVPEQTSPTQGSERSPQHSSAAAQHNNTEVKREAQFSPPHSELSPSRHHQAESVGSPTLTEDRPSGTEVTEYDDHNHGVVIKPEASLPLSSNINGSENRNECDTDVENDENYIDVVVKSEPGAASPPRDLSHAEKDVQRNGSENNDHLTRHQPHSPGSPRNSGRIAVPNLVAATRPVAPLSPVNGSVAPSGDTHGLYHNMADRNFQRYCKQCNASFTYLSSFVAHKKHYCSSHVGEKKPTPMEISG